MELTLKELLALLPKPSPRTQSADTYGAGFNDCISETEFKIREYFKKEKV